MSTLLRRLMGFQGYMDAAGGEGGVGGGVAAPASGDPAPASGDPAPASGDPAPAAGDPAPASGDPAPASGDPAAAPVVPETYADFIAPEGVELDAGIMGAFGPAAKKIGLTQEQAQTLVNELAPVVGNQAQATVDALHAKAVETWIADAKADPEIGGAAFEANLAVSKAGLEAFASPDFVKFLNESGLGSHPGMIRTFHKIGQLVQQDPNLVRGGGADKNSLEARLYSNTTTS